MSHSPFTPVGTGRCTFSQETTFYDGGDRVCARRPICRKAASLAPRVRRGTKSLAHRRDRQTNRWSRAPLLVARGESSEAVRSPHVSITPKMLLDRPCLAEDDPYLRCPSYEIENISFAQLVFLTKPAVWRALFYAKCRNSFMLSSLLHLPKDVVERNTSDRPERHYKRRAN